MEKTVESSNTPQGNDDVDADDEDGGGERGGTGENSWVEINIDMPGFRDDDPLPVFLAAMLIEALLASGDLPARLYISRRFHWRLYIDVSMLPYPPY